MKLDPKAAVDPVIVRGRKLGTSRHWCGGFAVMLQRLVAILLATGESGLFKLQRAERVRLHFTPDPPY